MKTSKLFRVIVTVIVLTSIIAVCSNISFAEGDGNAAKALPSPTAGDKILPPPAEISTDPDFASASSQGQGGKTSLAMAATDDPTSIYGNCAISRLSSSSCSIWGNTGCYPSDPAVRVTLRLQAYYNGAWITLACISNCTYNGTYVSVTQAYNVTPGYYYRCYGVHSSIYCGTTTTCTNSLYIG